MHEVLLLTQEVGEGAKILSRNDLAVSTEKVTIASLRNRTEQFISGIQLDYGVDGNDTSDDNQTILDVKVNQ
jgi:hypothetical protein